MSILIKQVIHNGAPCDVLIEGNRFKKIAPHIDCVADQILDGRHKAILPAFYNTHNHAAMTSMRGYADDIDLFPWLKNHIWPFEACITSEDVYHCTRLAILEMIRGGTVFFNDMYWFSTSTVRAVEEMGIRAAIGRLFIESSPGVILDGNLKENEALEALASSASSRITLTYAPHAIYTVSGKTLCMISERAKAENAFIHIHASETEREVSNSHKDHGMSPIAWLDRCGMLGPKTILAHCVHLAVEDINLIRERGCIIAHNPISNLKLASGRFRFQEVIEESKCRITLGTDGVASNNNLSMLDTMKFAALSAKDQSRNATVAPAHVIFDTATLKGAEAFNIQAGTIAERRLADAILVDLCQPAMVPNHHLISNMVYAADTSCIDSVLCDGRLLMHNRIIPGEQDIIEAAQRAIAGILERLNQEHRKREGL
jgi:5-methylthioadenosine/S-adenosylhomocysteine deaminase